MTKYKHNHSILVFCPFCDVDLCEVHQIVRQAHAPSQPVTLCPTCGEIILYTEENFRKPSDAEYLEIYENTTIREAREAFVKIKDGTENCNNITRMWKHYAEEKLAGMLHTEQDIDASTMYDILQDVFFSGATAAAVYAKRHAEDSESRDELMTKLFILELELQAYDQWAQREHEGDHYHGQEA